MELIKPKWGIQVLESLWKLLCRFLGKDSMKEVKKIVCKV